MKENLKELNLKESDMSAVSGGDGPLNASGPVSLPDQPGNQTLLSQNESHPPEIPPQN